MNPYFSIKPLPAISFGPGSLVKLTSLTESIGSRLLVITGEGFNTRQINWAKTEKKLHRAGIQLEYVRITAEPAPEVIDAIVATDRRQ